LANEGVEADAKRLLAVLAHKHTARRGGPIGVGHEDAEDAGFGAGPPGERLDRAVWRLIAEGALEAVVEEPGASEGEESGALYRVTRVGLEEEARDG
jgi:hypothetical protein